MSKDYYLSAVDIPSNMRLLGTIAFLWGQFTAGTPQITDFPELARSRQNATKSFLSKLSRRLLGHSNGSALAVIGNVDFSLGYSLQKGNGEADIETIESVLNQLMDGCTVGKAMEAIYKRYAILASRLAEGYRKLVIEENPVNTTQRMSELQKIREFSLMPIEARNYIIVGDPAVHLPINLNEKSLNSESDWTRPVIETPKPIIIG